MSFARAVVFLWAASARNRALHQVRRLRQPKYLVGALVGALYVYSLFLRRLGYQQEWAVVSPMARLFSEFMLGTAMLGTLLSAWALGPDRPALSFSETEVQHLFPAPVSRRELLHFKLARGLGGAAVGALAATVFVGRVLSPHPVLFFLGTTVTLTTVSLHVTAASFMRTRLARRGTSGTVVRWVLLTAVCALLIGAAMEALSHHPFPEEGWNPLMLRQWVLALSTSPALWPGRALVALPLAQDVGAFLRRLPLGLGLLAVHYAWVMKAAVPFEESAVGRAEERARIREQLAQRGGRSLPPRTSAPPFRLAAVGRPEVAILWKNLIAGKRTGSVGRLVGAALLGGVVAVAASGESPGEALAQLSGFLSPLCGGFAVLLCFFGPSAVRTDLRMDLPRLEQLRALPLTGRQVVAAELAAPALLLGVAQVGLLGVAVGGSVWRAEGWNELWVALGLGAVWLLPAVTLGGLFVQNAAVVLFPAWLPPEGERARGLEAIGQRLLTLVGTMVVLLVGMLPAAFLAAVVGFGLYQLLDAGVWALPFAGFTAALVLVTEVALGIVALGHAFDQLDVSVEGTGVTS
ncbi:hypothetical protein D187_004136 [Cystobacter fuscus DSM 2262]|uniref:Uncharacterized protein n=1 Tax=Cystobacter fuscus (strain ATCC 25194 / DSM 2262 / NBRC 100088 / M29) TaxID=1242864 RepID=S9P1M9_CYSF2|nr:putative ABC exporter domain-containing protein [Cystobacter fuscus]EPX58380.1 hypothetical protein D187_004136 [Cystobacter fuscus DSM 2262]